MPLNPIFGVAPVANTAPSQAEAEAGTVTTERVWTAQRVSQAIAALTALPRSYLAGLTLSNGTDATNDINIAVGEARSTADDSDLTVSTAIGKQIDASWAPGGTTGTPTGGLSSSLTLTNDTLYHVILGLVSGTEEVGIDTSITGASLVTDHSFTNTRRIGSVRRGTATNLAFTQVEDEFILADPLLDIDVNNPGTSAALRTLTVPTGVRVRAIINVAETATTNNPLLYISTPDANDEAPSSSAGPLLTMAIQSSAPQVDGQRLIILTNTSAQVRARQDASDANNNLRMATLGWVDRRGRDD